MLCCRLLVIQNNRENAERADYLSRSLFLLFFRAIFRRIYSVLSVRKNIRYACKYAV